MKQKPTFIFLTGLFFLTVSAFPQTITVTPTSTPVTIHYTYEQLKQNLTAYLHEQMDKEHVKGLSIALVDGPDIVWTQGFGWADEGKEIPATADTRFALGGVSHVFTAAEVMHLAEKGKISLDAPIQQYLPRFSIHSRFKKAKPITPRALLAGHSGLPGFYLKGIWVEKPESLARLVRDLKTDYLYDIPQTHYRYSYTDYDLLGRLVEIEKKESFSEAMEEDLFEPLGMDSSAFETPIPGQITAAGYINGNPFPQQRLRDMPAGGMVSSANDMARFLSFLFGAEPAGEAPLGEKSLKVLFTPQYPGRPFDFGHEVGMGWNLTGFSVDDAGPVAWCDGTYPGYFADLVVLRDQNLAVAILSNSSEAGKIADDLASRALKLALQVKEGLQQNLEKKKIEMPKVVEVPKETLEGYAGFYSALGQLTRIKAREKDMEAELAGHTLALRPISQDTFVPQFSLLFITVDLPQYPLTFSMVGDQQVALLGGLHFPIPFQEIEPVEIPDAWKEREGDYTLENGDGQLEFSRISLGEKDGFLTVVMKVSLKALHIKDEEFKVALLPLSDMDAVVPGLFYGDGGTLHAETDEEENSRIYYSGYWFKQKKALQPTPTEDKPKMSPTP